MRSKTQNQINMYLSASISVWNFIYVAVLWMSNEVCNVECPSSQSSTKNSRTHNSQITFTVSLNKLKKNSQTSIHSYRSGWSEFRALIMISQKAEEKVWMYGKKSFCRRRGKRAAGCRGRAPCVKDESRENKACAVFPSGHGLTFPCNIIHAPISWKCQGWVPLAVPLRKCE